LDLGLQGRVATITGGSHGVGYAIAEALLAEGCRVAICARDKARLDAAARSLEGTRNVEKSQSPGDAVLAHPADVAKPGEVEDFVKLAASHFGGLDILVHNAGGGGGGGLDAPDIEFDQALELNVLAGLRAARAAVPFMRKRGRGRIIFISSVYGRESGGRAGYNVAKAAEISLAKALSRELAKDKILVNTVAPGSLMFPGSSWERRQRADPEGIEAFTKSDLPLGRFGKPEEVAAVVAFLASDRASLVTGACWTVDGGQSRSLI
jgi:3-oxoacyl-[acyl-carrier protein] reductase